KACVPEHVLRLLHALGTGTDGALEGGIDLRGLAELDRDGHRGADAVAWRPGPAVLGELVAQKHGAAVDGDVGVHEALAVLGGHALLLLGAEGLPVEGNRIRGAIYGQIRIDGLHLGLRGSPGRHVNSPRLDVVDRPSGSWLAQGRPEVLSIG